MKPPGNIPIDLINTGTSYFILKSFNKRTNHILRENSMTFTDGFLGNANDQGKASLEFRHRAFRDQRIFKGNLNENLIF